MTDSAAADLNVPAEASQPMTPADVWAERQRLLADPEWRAAFERGSPEKRVEMNRVMASGTRWGFGETVNVADFGPKVAEQVAAQRAEQAKVMRQQAVDDLRARASISTEVEKMVVEGGAVSAAEKRAAQEERDRLIHDQEFTRRLRAGDSEAQSRWALLQIIRAAPLKAA